MPSRVKSRRERLAGRPVLLTALGLIAVQLVVRAWQVFPSTYNQDDFMFLRFAREQGFTLDYLFQGWNGHLQPIGFAMTWVLAQFPGNYVPAALFTLLVQLLASLALLALLRELVGERWALVVGLSVFLFSPLTQANVTWWASFIITIPVQLTLALCGYCHVRFLRTRNSLWVVATVGALLLGFGFTEKCVVVPVFLFLLTILDARGGPREVVRLLLRLWPVWLVYVAVNVAYLVAYLTWVGTDSSQPAESVGSFLSFARHQIWDVFVVGLFGGPWHASYAKTAMFAFNSYATRLVILQAVIALAILAYWRRGARSLVGWAVLAVYLAINVSITGSGRGYWGDLLAGDIRYITDALPVAAVVITVLLTPTREATQSVDIVMRRYPRAMTVLAVLFIFNSSMVTLSQSVPAYHDSYVRAYLANVRTALARDPDLDLYNGPVSANIMLPLFGAGNNTTKVVLDAYDLHPRYDVPSEKMRILDDAGNAWPVFPSFATNAIISGVRDCGLALGRNRHQVVRFERFVPRGTQVMKITYYTSGHGSLRLGTPDHEYDIGLDIGARSVFLVVEGGMPALNLSLTSGDGTICVNAISVGYPIPDTSSVQ
jgi:hypothetical protein